MTLFLVMLQYGSCSDFLCAAGVLPRFFRAFQDMFVHALLFLADASKVLLARHNISRKEVSISGTIRHKFANYWIGEPLAMLTARIAHSEP
jgi:hypothetical protein